MAALKKNVEDLIKARGLSRSQFSTRIGMTEPALEEFLESPPKRSEGVIKSISRELLVPDILLFAEEFSPKQFSLPDFRMTHPSPHGYSRKTWRWIELADSVRRSANAIYPPEFNNSLRAFLGDAPSSKIAAANLRTRLGITDSIQQETADARLFFSYLRKQIEIFDLFVLQLSFPLEDGSGFCLTGEGYDVIVLNTLWQNHSRRLFTLAHELYHCVLSRSGISDPSLVNNNTERKCNKFAVEFLAPESLVRLVAGSTITSNSFDIEELNRFSKRTKLSLYASVLRLIELGIYGQRALGGWNSFIAGNPDFEIVKGGGGGRTDEWKYKLSRYGFKFAEVFGRASREGEVDPFELFQIAGIKPKFQLDYFANAQVASAEDAGVDDDDVEGGDNG